MKRYPVMYNDFVIVGPKDDPAGIKGKDVVTALQTIKAKAVQHPTVKKEAGQRFIDWLVSPEGQSTIAGFKINGQQLFYPNSNDPNA